MIISIRGTSGSGKTFLVRAIMAEYATRDPVMVPWNKRPVAYHLTRPTHRPLIVLGSYENKCGGCDTLAHITNFTDYIFDMVKWGHNFGADVVFEGLLMHSEVRRTAQLQADAFPIFVIALNTPLEVCLESINQRRRERDPDLPPVNPQNTADKWNAIPRSVIRLKGYNVPAEMLGREDAMMRIRQLLKL